MKEMSSELKIFYEKVAFEFITDEIKNALHKIADDIAEKYMKETDIELVFTKKVGEELKDDIIVIKLKARK